MITRFAPSPTGLLHLGHAYSALVISEVAKSADGTVLLRIEDTDSTRCRPEYITALIEDLEWSGLKWDGEVRQQSKYLEEYARALDTLSDKGLLYPCSCTRKTIINAGARPGWDGLVYPGTCRHRKMAVATKGDALRLNLNIVWQHIVKEPVFMEVGPVHPGRHLVGRQETLDMIGDPVLQRKDTGDPAYHLACTHDDALQGITHVIRGEDLFRQTWLHVLIQTVMGWPTPIYHHHALIRDDAGLRLAKITNSRSIKSYRNEGMDPTEIRAHLKSLIENGKY